MVGHQHFAFEVLMQAASHLADRQFILKQFLAADCAETDDVLGPKDLELASVIVAAVLKFGWFRVSISRWTAFDRVQNVDIFAL